MKKLLSLIPLKMKITIFMSLCFIGILYANNNYAQKKSLNISAQTLTVHEVLNNIEKQTGYTFFYNTKQVDLSRKVNIKASNENIFQVLKKIFTGTNICYKILDKSIILSYSNKLNAACLSQQDDNILKGKVVDDKGVAIIGANVIIQGLHSGTITDMNGMFSIKAKKGDVLIISSIGYHTVKINVDQQNSIHVVLRESIQDLNEVVVIGYGTVRKSDLTGALSSVNDKSFSEQNVNRIDQVLQGRASGVQISNTVGAPGGDVRIRIRGANSVLGDNNPLFVVDGFVGADYSLLNPNDIKSIEVLKDASSTAIYGSRGANGVILVTTKSGNKDGKVNLTYSGSISLSSLIKKYDMLDAGDFATLVNDHDDAMGVSKHTFSDQQIQDYYKNGGFDYMNAIFRTALSTQHQISVAGGNEKTQFRISGNYLLQRGIIENSSYRRYTVRANLNTKINDKLSFRFNVNGASSEGINNQARTGASNPIVQAMSWAPTTNPYDGNGGYLLSDPVGSIKTNPLAMIYDSESKFGRTFVNAMAGIRYEIIPGLSADFQTVCDLGFFNNKYWNGEYASNHQPSASKDNSQSLTVQTTTQLTYDKTFLKFHHINVVAAIETQRYNWESLSGSAANLKFPELKYNNLAQAGSTSVNSDYSMWSLLSFLGRINYSLMDKYLLSFSMRRDGSSKFASGNKYSTFPAGAIAWNAGNEDFIKNLNIFSKLKLRASWGLTGSQAISPYATLSSYDTSIYYAYNTSGRTNGIQMGNPGNRDLKWETTEQKDLGLEFGFFNNRLNVEVDYYIKNTKDLLLNKSIPYFLGGGSITANVGKMQNKGFEINISSDIISNKDLNWNSSLNFTTVRNRVTNLGSETEIFSNTNISGWNGQAEFIYKVGQPLGSFWGLRYLGPWQKSEATEAAKFGCKPGDAKYQDMDGNHSIDGSDYQIIGCGMPKYTFGWNNTITYKNFTLNAFFQGVFGIKKLNYNRCMNLCAARDAREATLEEAKSRYVVGKNENAWLPAWSPTSKWEPQSTLFMENASYLRMKNISLAYTFNISKVGAFKVALSATNLLTFTKYKGNDPESSNVGGDGSDIRQGIDYGSYPNSKNYTLDFNITF